MAFEVRNLTKSFGEQKVLDGLSHRFPDGEITCVMGPSGCGKTTLLNILLGLLSPDSGETPDFSDARLSAVFQEDRLCENVGAVSNIRLVNPSVTKKQAQEMLDAVGLDEEDVLHKPVSKLSGGQRRRVAILGAVAVDCDVMLLDEPFKGLDEETRTRVMSYFARQVRGKTVILVTHDWREADFLKGNVLALDNGNLPAD